MSKKTILTVDDDPNVLDLFKDMLHVCDPDIEVITAANGKEALVQLRENTPDLMLLDLVMSELNGWQVLETMAEDPTIPKVPAFFVSAQDPYDQPPHSEFLYVAAKEGFSINQILRCSLDLSDLLLQPEVVSDPTLGQTALG